MKTRSLPRLLPTVVSSLLVFSPTVLLAHPGHVHTGEEDEFATLTTGFAHPFTGFDHLLLALAIGWIVYGFYKAKAWVPALSFIAAMAVGAGIGHGHDGGSGLEIALSLSVIGAGAIILTGQRTQKNLLVSGMALAGIVHGYAHGSEAVSNSQFIIYSIGFLAGTASILGIGSLLFLGASRLPVPSLSKIAGVALVAFGLVSLIQPA